MPSWPLYSSTGHLAGSRHPARHPSLWARTWHSRTDLVRAQAAPRPSQYPLPALSSDCLSPSRSAPLTLASVVEYHDTLVMNSRRLTDLRGRCPASPWRREHDPPAWAPGDRLPRPAFIHELNIQPIDALGSHQPHRCRDRPAPTGSVHGAASRTARPPASATALRARPPFHSLVPDLPHQDLFLTI